MIGLSSVECPGLATWQTVTWFPDVARFVRYVWRIRGLIASHPVRTHLLLYFFVLLFIHLSGLSLPGISGSAAYCFVCLRTFALEMRIYSDIMARFNLVRFFRSALATKFLYIYSRTEWCVSVAFPSHSLLLLFASGSVNLSWSTRSIFWYALCPPSTW